MRKMNKTNKINGINKRGDLLNNVLTLVIAVVGLALLAYGVFRLYQIVSSQEEENARKTLDVIEGKINALKEGQTGRFLVQGFPMKNEWHVIAYSKSDDIRPDKCFFNSCVCMCKILDLGSLSEYDYTFGIPQRSIANSCQKEGFCRKVDLPEAKIIVENIEFSGKYGENIKLQENVIELKINKSSEKLEMSRSA